MATRDTGLPKNYDPKPIEDKWYEWWLEKGIFQADADTSKEAFSIVIPPPTSRDPSTWGMRSTTPFRT